MNTKKQTSPRPTALSPTPSLPSHFADQVLDYETELDLDCSLKTVLKLMELYSVTPTQAAIEHYESISNPKYLHYQERLQSLLARKDVITLLNMGSPNAVSRQKPSEILQKMREQQVVRQRYRAHQVGIFMNKWVNQSKDAETLIKKRRSDDNLLRVKAIENIRNQESPDLEYRAEARRRRSGTPVGTLNRTFTMGSDRKKFENYQEEVEEIIEQCLKEREVMVEGVKKKYKEEIKEVRKMGNDAMVLQVVGQMKKQLQGEIEEIEKVMRDKRKSCIDELRRNFS